MNLTKMTFNKPTASAYLLIGALCVISLPWLSFADDETSGKSSSISSTRLEEGSAAGEMEEEKEVEGGGGGGGGGEGRKFFGRSDLQKRRNSFRSDLGKRSDPAEVKDKRGGPRMKSFRSDLGKRKLEVAVIRPSRRELDLDEDSGETGPTRVRACDNTGPSSYGRRRRYAEEEEELEDELENGGSFTDLEKRARSSFRSDLGRRSVDLSGGFEPGLRPKRSGFRGDLGKRSGSLSGAWWKPSAESKDKRFRGDLGRKRSLTLGDVGSVEFLDGDGSDIHRLFLQQSGGLLDEDSQGIEEGLEKRRFRSDLG